MTEGDATLTVGTAPRARAGHKVVRVDANGSAWVEAFRCADCGAVMAEETPACRRCGGRGTLRAFRPGHSGALYSWTVIHRSYPGIKVPFVSAIVDIDGGLTLKGTLQIDDPAALRAGMPVNLVMDDAGGATDTDGRPYVGFHFVVGEQGA